MFFKVIVIFIYFNSIFGIDSNVDIKTSSGLVRGKSIQVADQKVNQFLGIPFAEPPVGTLRFSKPKPIQKPFEGIIDATKTKHSCMQTPYLAGPIWNEKLNISEDCLFLNIWTPKPQNDSSVLKPVMFWIHGGNFTMGSVFQPFLNGKTLASHDVVVVTANYRLGPFGFFYGGTENEPGNLGLYDQLLALKWVKENVHLFGGDKNQITIFGISSGSWAVSSHIFSPLSEGLFKRAIMESGAQFYGNKRSIITKEEALKQSKRLAKNFNCNDDNKWFDCLRAVDAHKLLTPDCQIGAYPLEGTEFLPISAQKAFKDKKFISEIDLIAGVTRDEGSAMADWAWDMLKNDYNEKIYKNFVSIFKSFMFTDLNVESVMDLYFKNVVKTNASALRNAVNVFYGDIIMTCPTYLFAKQFAQNNQNKKIYFYELTYQSKDMVNEGCVEETMGICHGADVHFVFGNFFDQKLVSSLDKTFSEEVMKMWTNFAKTGEPGSNWPQLIDHDSSVVKNLNPHDLNGVFVDPFKWNCEQFWSKYFI